jgi:ATP-dependent RNA helicase RhlE
VLGRADCESAIVFTRTKHRARRLAEQLRKAGHRAVGIQGNLSQSQRDRAMRGFRARQYDVLVATDIVARGIDVSGVSHVINYDVPNTPEAYTHRIGRTGRAEREGVACTFVTAEDSGWLRATERMIGAPIARREVAGFEYREIAPEPMRPASRTGGRPYAGTGARGGRRSGGRRHRARR